MKKFFKGWNEALQALVLIKIGQELGSDSRFSRMVHDLIDFLISLK